eukprot:11230691-Karenia_brevis.AAC.2
MGRARRYAEPTLRKESENSHARPWALRSAKRAIQSAGMRREIERRRPRECREGGGAVPPERHGRENRPAGSQHRPPGWR